MKQKKLEVGQYRSWTSKAFRGHGMITEIRQTAKGAYITLKTRGHPKGEVSVRESQVK